jgi:hypothetical protein
MSRFLVAIPFRPPLRIAMIDLFHIHGFVYVEDQQQSICMLVRANDSFTGNDRYSWSRQWMSQNCPPILPEFWTAVEPRREVNVSTRHRENKGVSDGQASLFV